MKKIPFLRPNLVKKEALLPYLEEIETSRMYSNFGPLNKRFEKRVLEEYFDNIGDAATVSNATIGLILAISACKNPKGKYALMPSFTFAATPLAALWCGLEPFFIDIRPNDWCMNEELLEDTIKKLGNDVAVVIPYATFGTYLDLTFYQQLHKSDIPVVIDAAASFGVRGKQGHFGKSFPGFVVYSFHATKSFGVGEGGLVYSGNREFITKIRQAENFGFSSDRTSNLLGLNGKISEYTAAIALSTLDVFEEKIKKRKQIYSWYVEQLHQNDLLSKGWTLQKTEGDIPHQFMPLTCPKNIHNHDIITFLKNDQIEARTYFSPPCHLQPLFSKYPQTSLTATNQIAKQIISLPLWEEMTEEDVRKIVGRLVSFK
ncbi:DegT/DnrJ/EryC1/StrS family aminotransferase [Calidifontibacillus erzurumensis]|uniref:Aminotransferase class I/II-fold pyridoxal phosphate-dependent enzyme n=1 Tax=Calidifontibacillus erzurumensis TaxID=2741433 RepID=A0A8J8KCJ2_9BACI|nr:aminotransferase class I/II-fold pyridoxal phosphate-dependent enzyme [Calidifontibacillus erzurumensis]NSL52672.1 aminotransferase class I/II-fold pyridoxal phosphate-dependent enzyme [Calidifontibacillus erzurumensis]